MATTNARDYYQILEVDPGARPEVISAAYRRLAATYHPDVNSAPDAADRMKEINAAYETLSDPARRAAYDQARAMSRRVADQAGGRGAPPRPPETGLQYFIRAMVMMVLSGIILNLLFSALAGPNGRWLALIAIVGLLLWKGGPILRMFDGRRS